MRPAFLASFAVAMLLSPAMSRAQEPVTVLNFVRAETDETFRRYVSQGALGKFVHIRLPTPLDSQDVIRMNQDTLYSIGIFDLTESITVTKPRTERWQSMMLVNQDHSIPAAIYEPGSYTFMRETMGTRYMAVLFRTLVNANDPEDISEANAIQDEITVEQAAVGSLEIPDWDLESLSTVRDAINVLGATLSDTSGMLGDKGQARSDPVFDWHRYGLGRKSQGGCVLRERLPGAERRNGESRSDRKGRPRRRFRLDYGSQRIGFHGAERPEQELLKQPDSHT